MISPSIRALHIIITMAATLVAETALAQEADMNSYLLRAKKLLLEKHAGGGYDINARYTHDLPFHNETISGGPKKPKSMCVAAIIELITHAFQLHYEEHHNAKIFTFLGKNSWDRLRPIDIKSHIWVNSDLNSSGTGDALSAFGLGKRLKFSELRKGDFVNLNRPPFPGHRSRASGHAVLFLSYVDDSGKDIESSNGAAGFRYFSNQSSTNGFGEKIAFFLKKNNKEWFCPSVPNASMDCGVMFSNDQRYLNAGRMSSPEDWRADVRDTYLAKLKEDIYQTTKSKGPAYLGLDASISKADFDKAIEELPDVMKVAPIYEATDF